MDPHAKRAVIMHIASSGLLHYSKSTPYGYNTCKISM